MDIEEDMSTINLPEMNIIDLNKLLDQAIKDEDYEKASRIRDEINRRETS